MQILSFEKKLLLGTEYPFNGIRAITNKNIFEGGGGGAFSKGDGYWKEGA